MQDVFELIESNNSIFALPEPEKSYFEGLKTLSEDLSHSDFFDEQGNKIIPCLKVLVDVTNLSLESVSYFLNYFFPKIFDLYESNESELSLTSDISEFFDIFFYVVSISIRNISNFEQKSLDSLRLKDLLAKTVQFHYFFQKVDFDHSDLLRRVVSVIRDTVKILTKFDMLDSVLNSNQELEKDVLKILES